MYIPAQMVNIGKTAFQSPPPKSALCPFSDRFSPPFLLETHSCNSMRLRSQSKAPVAVMGLRRLIQGPHQHNACWRSQQWHMFCAALVA